MNQRKDFPLIVAAILVPLTFATACDRRADTPERAQETQTTGAQQTHQVEAVKDDPARFYGKKVTLTGEVDKVAHDSRSFTLEGNDWLFTDKIRVLARTPVQLPGAKLGEDDDVVIRGTVRKFAAADVERDLGWKPTPEMEAELRDKPVLIAEEVRRTETSAAWTADKPEGEIISVVSFVTTVAPDTLAGQHVRLQRVMVQNATGKGIWIGPSHAHETFVLLPSGTEATSFKKGDVVDVQGTVRKTPPAAEAMKSWSQPESLKSVIAGEPLFVEASKVTQAKK